MTKRKTSLGTLAVVVWLVGAAAPPGPPPDDRIPEIAAQLEGLLAVKDVVAPDGSKVVVAGGSSGASMLLDVGRIETCLRTIGAADAWPAAWLVVQIEALSFDVVLPVRLDDSGALEDPDPVFAAERREWTVDGLRDAIREVTGRKPGGRSWNLVVQGFRTRVENRFVYDLPADRRGLLALLPEGTLLREAKAVELPGGRSYTLALVLREAEFVPSTCDDCASKILGHADTGRVILVLTDDTEVRDEVDLTDLLTSPDGRPLVPRYRCEDRDSDPAERERSIEERFSSRPRVLVLVPQDLDGDGLALEIEIVSRVEDCVARTVTLAVVPTERPKLYIVPR